MPHPTRASGSQKMPGVACWRWQECTLPARLKARTSCWRRPARTRSSSRPCSFRLWTRPQVKVGGRYAIGEAELEVDDIELVPFSSVTAADVRKSGEPYLESLRRRAAHAGPITDDTLVYRIEFHIVH